MADPNDLCTASYATSVLAAGNFTLSTAQAAVLPALITAASRAMVRFLGRAVALATFDEIVTPEGARQDRGEPATAKLAAFPVVSLVRVFTGRSSALRIANTDPLANQIATVGFVVAGDLESSALAATGVVLSRTASATVTTSTLTFAANPTVNALAAAINALGGGWSAAVAGTGGSTPNLGLFPTADLVGVREPKDASGPGATLDLFTQPATDYDIDRATGILRVYGRGGAGGLGWGGGYGDPSGASCDGLGGWGGGSLGGSPYRVTYTAGWTNIPEPLQQVCAELVKATLERLATDSTLQDETAKDYSYTVRDAWLLLPEWALQVLHFYKDWKV